MPVYHEKPELAKSGWPTFIYRPCFARVGDELVGADATCLLAPPANFAKIHWHRSIPCNSQVTGQNVLLVIYLCYTHFSYHGFNTRETNAIIYIVWRGR